MKNSDKSLQIRMDFSSEIWYNGNVSKYGLVDRFRVQPTEELK